MRLLVLGRDGQLARSLAERAASHPALQFEFASRPEFDLGDDGSIAATIGAAAPDIVLNAAAYTAVDRAESDADAAHRINALAPAAIARAARQAGARLIHVSTDYVFDGQSPAPYSEDAATGPINVYGRTKLQGEAGIRAELPDRHLIVRTSWVYSPFGNNFVKTMLNLAGTRDSLSVVDDQVGTPTSALDLAEGLLTATARWSADPSLGGTYHFAGLGCTSWAGLAAYVMASSRRCGGPSAEILPIATADYPTAAARPRFSILDTSKFSTAFGHPPQPWQESVDRVVERLIDLPG